MNEFTIELSSDLNYEEMVIYLSFRDQEIALITQEEGLDKVQVQFFFEELRNLSVPLEGLIKAPKRWSNMVS